jgi:hypothetical protein
MGIESDHRTLARVICRDIPPQNGGPLSAVTGLQGIPEPANPPNNNEYERTQKWNSIDQLVQKHTFSALRPKHRGCNSFCGVFGYVGNMKLAQEMLANFFRLFETPVFPGISWPQAKDIEWS